MVEHHRKSVRLKNFDYSQQGYYYVTICTQNRVNWFGRIEGDQMVLNDFGEIVRSFKSAVSKRINELRNTPGMTVWQKNYYDHIIRDEMDLHRIRRYINENPSMWDRDRNNVVMSG